MVKKVYETRLKQKKTRSDILRNRIYMEKKYIWRGDIYKKEINKEGIYMRRDV